MEDISVDNKSNINRVIKGKEGYIALNKTEALNKIEYANYSDDGKIFIMDLRNFIIFEIHILEELSQM